MAGGYVGTYLLGTISVLVLLWYLTAKEKLDPREPPAAPSPIPVIGHVVGLMRRKFNYYVDLK